MISPLPDALAFLTSGCLLALGAVLHAYAPHHRTALLRRLQTRELTAGHVQRAARFFRWSVPGLRLIALALLALAGWHALQ